MTHDERNKRIQELFEECFEIQDKKGADYAPSDQANDNFMRNAVDLGLTQFQIWAVYAFKHIDTIKSAIRLSPKNPALALKSEHIRGRIRDGINYLAILETMLDDLAMSETPIISKNGDYVQNPNRGKF
jgi:hypothetical protein